MKLILDCTKAKSRKNQGVFKAKSQVKIWQVRGIWSQQLEKQCFSQSMFLAKYKAMNAFLSLLLIRIASTLKKKS